jgi:signal transduction histidine kinase
VSDLVAAMKAYSYMDQAPLQEVDVQEALEHTLTILNHKLKHGIEVTRDYAPDLPKVWAYGSELNQVWTNLIDNAIDAMAGQERPAQLHVRTWLEGERVQIEICDNGCGIAPDILPRIFEPFFTTKDVGQGSGLGLDVAYRIVVAQHAGDIRVKSEPGDTRFQVCLPVRFNG